MRWRGAAFPMPTCAPSKSREREVTTKNGKAGHVSSSESQGIGIRVLAFGCWGFAATDDLSQAGIEARRRAGARDRARRRRGASKGDVVLAPEEKYEATWVSPCAIDPFSIPVDRNLATLLAVDARTAPQSRHQPGRSLHALRARERQVFASTLGSLIDQTRYHQRRGILGPQLQGRRNPEALLSRTPLAASTS